jgi:hypothetical protein
VEEYRLFAGSRRADGRARSEEARLGDGRVLCFSAELGAPPDIAVAGELHLDARLAVRSFSVDVDGRLLELTPAAGEELEVDGAPALYGVTARRLRAAGMRPAQVRDVDVVRVDRRLGVRRTRARYTWLGGQAWRYESGREWAWVSIRPEDGVVRSVLDGAELDE